MDPSFEPGYVRLLETGELDRRVDESYQHLTCCDLCAWECKQNRRAGKLGVCQTGELALVSSFGAHLGEEDPLRGWRGSGTIFFSRCNLRCQFCQNYDISQAESGEPVTPEALAAIMLELQSDGCHNINFVSPSHVVAQILAGVRIAAQNGLRLPLVYNTGGYDSLTALRLLDSVIDIYMPDMKYASQHTARSLSKAANYPQVNQAAVKEMYRQVGDLELDQHGLAQRGLLVRHLVLPNGTAGTPQVIQFLAKEISPNTYVNIMDQYQPEFNVRRYPNQFQKINRRITANEYQAAIDQAHQAGLSRLDPPRVY